MTWGDFIFAVLILANVTFVVGGAMFIAEKIEAPRPEWALSPVCSEGSVVMHVNYRVYSDELNDAVTHLTNKGYSNVSIERWTEHYEVSADCVW